MSTRSRIGILNQDESIESVYHHSDGYPEWLGVFLKRNYSDTSKVRELMELGDISCIHSKHDWDMKEVKEPIIRTFNQRGEKTMAQEHEDLNDYIFYDPVQIEYSYLWNTDLKEWKCYKAEFDYDWNIPKAPTVVDIPKTSRFFD